MVDIKNELSDVAAEVEMLSGALDIFAHEADGGTAWNWLAVQGLASGVEAIYTGCERVMALIAKDVDGAAINKSDGWHVSLLKRMAHPFPEVRDAAISDECYRDLDRLRSFRHRVRNSYGLGLDKNLVLERAIEAKRAFRRFHSEISVLILRQASQR